MNQEGNHATRIYRRPAGSGVAPGRARFCLASLLLVASGPVLALTQAEFDQGIDKMFSLLAVASLFVIWAMGFHKGGQR